MNSIFLLKKKMTNILTFMELNIETDNLTLYHIVNFQKSLIRILTDFQFKSDKSLVKFLKEYQNLILEKLDPNNPNLEKLENQKFLDYLEVKWYESLIPELITPEQILNLAIETGSIKYEDIEEYLLEDSGIFVYKLIPGILNSSN